jgi:hypothetical protein
MGDSETGGDGSVQWNVAVAKVRKKSNGDPDVTNEPTGGGNGHHQGGIDEDGVAGDNMTISVRVPQGKTAANFLAYLQATGLAISGNRVYFNIKIEANTHDQVRVSWGSSNNVMSTPLPMP